MPISKRTLTKWRKEALQSINNLSKIHSSTVSISLSGQIEFNKRILQMTQELIDQKLIKENNK